MEDLREQRERPGERVEVVLEALERGNRPRPRAALERRGAEAQLRFAARRERAERAEPRLPRPRRGLREVPRLRDEAQHRVARLVRRHRPRGPLREHPLEVREEARAGRRRAPPARRGGAARVVDAAQRLPQRARRDLAGEVLRRRLLEVVRLVEDDLRRLRERERRGLRLGEEDRVVRDDDVRGERRRARPLQEAAPVVRALAAAAVVGVRGDARGDGRLARLGLGRRGPGVELREVAGKRPQRPRHGARERRHRGRGELRLAAGDEPLQPREAEVVAAPLHEREADGRAQQLRDERQVLAEDLVLEVLRVRAHDDREVVRERPERRRDEVGHRLADARAGLHDEMARGGERGGDLARHPHLLRAALVAGHRALEEPARLEPAPDRGGVQLRVGRGVRRIAPARLARKRRNRREERARAALRRGREDEPRARGEPGAERAVALLLRAAEDFRADAQRLLRKPVEERPVRPRAARRGDGRGKSFERRIHRRRVYHTSDRTATPRGG